LWTRLAPKPLEGDGGMPDAGVPVQWELAIDPAMSRVVRRGEVIASPELAHSVHVDIDGLEPGREYWYRFVVAPYKTMTGRTKTLPQRDRQPESVRFAIASCQNYTHGFFVAYDHMVEDNPDFAIHLGDYIYDTSFRRQVSSTSGDGTRFTGRTDSFKTPTRRFRSLRPSTITTRSRMRIPRHSRSA
jgi:alkaline phosphatase D